MQACLLPMCVNTKVACNPKDVTNWHLRLVGLLRHFRKWTANAVIPISPPHPLKMDEGGQDQSLRPCTLLCLFRPCLHAALVKHTQFQHVGCHPQLLETIKIKVAPLPQKSEKPSNNYLGPVAFGHRLPGKSIIPGTGLRWPVKFNGNNDPPPDELPAHLGTHGSRPALGQKTGGINRNTKCNKSNWTQTETTM